MNIVHTSTDYPPISPTSAAALIGILGSENFFEDLADILSSEFGHMNFHLTLYSKDQAPTGLAKRPEPSHCQRGINNFLKYTYVINPAYRAFRRGYRSGIFSMLDFMNGSVDRVAVDQEIDVHLEDSETIGFRTPGWPKGFAEIVALINLPNETAIDISFQTPMGSQQTIQSKKALEQLFPVLNRLILQQYSLDGNSFAVATSSAEQQSKFNDFGEDVLTQRELEITHFILMGHSSSSIAMDLKITLPTVKTHRRNIYSKLQISSQAELFSLFLLHLR